MKLFTDVFHSPIDDIKILYSDNSLVGLYFDKYFNTRFRKFDYNNKLIESSVSIGVKKWLEDYFNYKNPDPKSLPLNPIVTPFQKDVYKILIEQPFGTTTTYGDLRDKFEYIHNRRMSAQAIGGAMRRNPIVIAIPCHRVLSKNKGVDNFACGIENKRYLLEFEKKFYDKETKEKITEKETCD